jgi:type II secretory pathway pseudopilin PulG
MSFVTNIRIHHRGFTLIEAGMAIVIVGVGIVALMQLFAAGTRANSGATDLTIGSSLANNIRELTQSLKFSDAGSPAHWGLETGETKLSADDLDDLDSQSFSPPIDARRTSLAGFSGWTQSIKVESIDPEHLNTVIAHGTVTPDQRPVSRVTVTVLHNGKFVCASDWLVTYLK